MTSLVAGVVDALGADLCAGRLAPGTALTLEAVQERTGIPVKLLGQGEGIDDLTGFTPHVFVQALVG